MTVLDAAHDLYNGGRFIEALRILEDARLIHDERIAGLVLRAALLLQLGRIGEARALAIDLLRSELSLLQRSSCEWVLGKVSRENREHELAVEHLHRAISFAKQAKSLPQLCKVQLSLMLLVCDTSGPEAATPLLADVRANTIKLGDIRTTAALHVFVGETEAKRGLLRSARRHAALALELLGREPNLWLESISENLFMAVAIEQADLSVGLKRGLRALDLAEQAGSASMRRTCLGNLGNVYYALGDFERATDYFERSHKALPSGVQAVSCITNLARARLSQGQISESARLLDGISQTACSDQDRNSYPYRYAALMQSVVLFRQNRLQDAIDQLQVVLRVCDQVGDEMLKRKALLTQAEVFLATGRYSDFRRAFDAVSTRLDGESPQLSVQYERILSSAAAVLGEARTAQYHLDRARRISQTCQLVSPEFAIAPSGGQLANLGPAIITWTSQDQATENTAGALIQSIAAMIANVSRPEFIGRELLATLESVKCVQSAAVTSRTEDDSQVLATIGQDESVAAGEHTRRLMIGQSGGRTIE